MTESIRESTPGVAADPEAGRPMPAGRPRPAGAAPRDPQREVLPWPPREPAPRFLTVLLRALSVWPA
jgi:hypothetical protein